MDSTSKGKENMSVMQVPTSPSFLKPKPIKLRKRALRPTALPLDNIDVKTQPEATISRFQSRIPNPFRQNKVKRKRDSEGLQNDEGASLLWREVNRVSTPSEAKKLPSPVVPSMMDESAVSSFSDNVSASFHPSAQKVLIPEAKDLPVEWSLKTKIRFTSTLPFPSRGTFRAFEEVNGTIGFIRCLHSSETDSKSSDVHTSPGAKFYQNCQVFMFPFLPWLNLFPRTESFSKVKGSDTVLGPDAKEALNAAWCNSFRNLYLQVSLRQCPYFYLCASTFTVLFRCAGAASIPVIHALITPTTKGFRKALAEEGISFTMPLYNSKESGESGFEDLLEDSPSFSSSADCSDKKSDDDSDPIDEDLEPDSWLESLGLSQDTFPSLNLKRRSSDNSFKGDKKPESLVYIEDRETQALVNFLLNSSFCETKIGPLAGIPPTLLSPTGFLNGMSKNLSIRHGKVKTEDGEKESIEVNGPLLPNNVHSLCSLFSTTQEQGFTAVLSSHLPTNTFNMINPQSPALPCVFAKNNLKDCGLPDVFVEQMCSKSQETATITNVRMNAGLFSWR